MRREGSGNAGGSLGCVPPGTFVPEFRDALIGLADGETSGVVQSDFGFHVILREGIDTSTTTTAEIVAIAGNDIILEVLREADVEVLERLGEWDSEEQPPQVIVPLS